MISLLLYKPNWEKHLRPSQAKDQIQISKRINLLKLL
jgi:hypothetical protein